MKCIAKWGLFIVLMFAIGYYSIPTISRATAEARIEYGLVVNSVEQMKLNWNKFDND